MTVVTPQKGRVLDSHVKQSVLTRLLDQRATDDSVLIALAIQDPAVAAAMKRLEPESQLRRSIKGIPLLGPLVQKIHRGVTGSRRSTP